MVYSGKPSTGCLTCRKRRIKCDESKPECNQCKKAYRHCQGYPDLTDRFFHHQTESTIKRIQRETARKKKDSSTPESHNDENQSESSQSEALSLYIRPQQSIEPIAINFYIHGTILDSLSNGHSVGHMEYLPQLYLQARSDSALSHVMTTAALAGFGKFGLGANATELAYKYYSTSISALSAALRDPVARATNETLMATLMMIPVESLLSKGSAPQERWAAHVRGAMWLLKERETTISADHVATQMQKTVQRFMAAGAEIRGESGDSFLSSIPRLAISSDSPDRQLSQLWHPIQTYRPRIMGLLQKDSTPEILLELTKASEICTAIDKLLIQWASKLPERYEFDVMSHIPATGGWRFTQHVYKDCHIQRVWNSFRCARIFLNAMVYQCALRVNDANNAQISGLLAVIRKLAVEICGSIPAQVLADTSLETPRSPGIMPQSLNPTQESVTAFYMMWPLFVARGVPSLPLVQREWIKTCFVELGSKYRIRGAEEYVEAGKDLRRPLLINSYDGDITENVWEYSFLYGCGGV